MLEQHTIQEAVDAAKNLFSALGPAALGSAVAQAYQRGLSWRDRFVQWAVGIIVSYYATLLIREVIGMGDLATQAVGFVLATLAFQATPKFIAGATEAAGALPVDLKDKLLGWLPGRKDPHA
jgi:hypothetical protein